MSLPVWKHKTEAYAQALKLISDRHRGVVQSLRCSSPKLNDAFADGFEWGTAACFAARPGGGKSVLKEQFIRDFFELNPTIDFRVLDWDLEMILRVSALREFSAVLGRSYKYLLSAEADSFGNKMNREEFERLKEYAALKKNFRDTGTDYPIDVIEDACNVRDFEQTVNNYMTTFKKADGSYTKTVVTVDHARLILKDGMKETDMLQELGAAIIRMKKKYNDCIIFIVFNHLNRKVLEPSRCEAGKIGNYITDDDILGSDAFSQSMDVVVAIDRPYNRKIQYYGPERFIIQDPYTLIFHFLKVRNGDTRMSFYLGQFNKMKIVELDEIPPTARETKPRS